MSTPTSYSEEECFNIYWKIKNFSYLFYGEIRSPEFDFIGNQYWLYLKAGVVNIECVIMTPNFAPVINLQRQISFLTCDGSPKESISGGPGLRLTVPKDAILENRRNAFLSDDTLTVRFRFPTNSDRGNVFIFSKIGVKCKYFLWTLKDLSESTLKKSIEKSVPYGDIELHLKQMDGCHTDKQFYVEIKRKGGGMCYYTLKMSVLDLEGNTLNEICDEYNFEKKDGLQVRGFPLFFKRKKLLASNNPVLFGDTLTLKCNFAISLGELDNQTDLWYCEGVTPLVKELKNNIKAEFKGKTDSFFVTELQDDLKSILDSGALADVSLKIDTEVIQVHKVILSARSAVFKAMFTNNMKETINNTVIIEDLDLETVHGLIHYMYTDTINDCHYENIRKLYSAADKYEVITLKNKCISWMKTNLSTSNVCEVLVLADLYRDEILKRATFDFISEYNSQIFTSEAWKDLKETNSNLALEVMCELWSKKNMMN